MTDRVTIIPIESIPEVVTGDDLAVLLLGALGPQGLHPGDVVVVTSKVVSKAEGRLVPAADREVSITDESARILRRTAGGMTISETRHGFVCANAGVDASNVPPGNIALLPTDPDASARRLRARIKHLAGVEVGVVVSDTFGRAWRLGQTDIAIGIAGIEPFTEYAGKTDSFGHELRATRIAIADEIAGAAELVMGKLEGICAAIVRGAPVTHGSGSATQLVRPPADDLFR